MITKLEKRMEEFAMNPDSKELLLLGSNIFRKMVLGYLVSPIADCHLEQRESLSRQEVIDLLEGISDKIKELGNEEVDKQ